VTRFGLVVWLVLTLWFAFVAALDCLRHGGPWYWGPTWLAAGGMSLFLLVVIRVVRL
jgi:hypothetical protein